MVLHRQRGGGSKVGEVGVTRYNTGTLWRHDGSGTTYAGGYLHSTFVDITDAFSIEEG